MALMPAALACFCAARPHPASGQPERWALERIVTIGDAFDPDTGLTLVGDVIVVGDRLVVAQPREQRLRAYSLAGDFLGFTGRSGVTQFVGSGWTSYVSIPESYRSLL